MLKHEALMRAKGCNGLLKEITALQQENEQLKEQIKEWADRFRNKAMTIPSSAPAVFIVKSRIKVSSIEQND